MKKTLVVSCFLALLCSWSNVYAATFDVSTGKLTISGLEIPGAGMYDATLTLTNQEKLEFAVESFTGSSASIPEATFDMATFIIRIPKVEITDGLGQKQYYTQEYKYVPDSGKLLLVQNSPYLPSVFTNLPTGIVGPQGPQGIQGPKGDPGPPGPRGTNGVSNMWYRVCSNKQFCSCLQTELLVGGGAQCPQNGSFLGQSQPLDLSRWSAVCVDQAGNHYAAAQITVLCITVDGLQP